MTETTETTKGDYPPKECPFCETVVKNLPAHLRRHCEDIPAESI